MIDRHEFLLFIPAMLAITFMPGPDMLFVLALSAHGGARQGIVGVLGIISGGFVHITAAALGLSALIFQSAFLFSLVKAAGAAYLIFLGLRTLFARDQTPPEKGALRPASNAWTAYRRGFITNLLNPKVALFMLAFLPQFVVPANGHVGLQIATLGAIWYGTALFVFGAVALAGGAVEGLRRRSRRARTIERVLTGSIFLGLGLRVALPDRR
jgi:threonine/homoserine/homoserine lactone efflux protein